MSRTDERNFRKHYYERVGCKDEKKKLDTLLNEEPRSIEKLQQFCLRFSVPSIMRLEAWKVIYEFSSLYTNNSDEKLWWKETPYYHIKHLEKLMQKITEDMTLPEELTVQFLVRQGWIKFDIKSQLEEELSKDFTAIATSMLRVTDSAEVASYYLSEEMFKFLHSHPERVLMDLEKSFEKNLTTSQPRLYSHCENIKLRQNWPLQRWMSRGYAGIIGDEALLRIWDKVVGGSMKILIYVALSFFDVYSTKILQKQCWSEVSKIFSKISEEKSNTIVQKAIDAWTKDGCQLLACDHSRVSRDETHIVPSNKILSQLSLSNKKLVNEINVEGNNILGIFESGEKKN